MSVDVCGPFNCMRHARLFAVDTLLAESRVLTTIKPFARRRARLARCGLLVPHVIFHPFTPVSFTQPRGTGDDRAYTRDIAQAVPCRDFVLSHATHQEETIARYVLSVILTLWLFLAGFRL